MTPSSQISKPQHVAVVTLGCARNTVDSQKILARLKKQGHTLCEVEQAQTVIVNTCSFIDDAKQESIDTVLELIEMKQQGKIQKIVLAGCLAQRYGHDLVGELSQVDAILGVPRLLKDESPDHQGIAPDKSVYVKICEGCFHHCTFCAIPRIKGPLVSRSIDSIVREVEALAGQGVKEINLIGQDITAYGKDIYERFELPRLLKAILPVAAGIEWIRLLYTYPQLLSEELIDLMAKENKICSYIDVPLQHISDRILKAMGRKITEQNIRDLIQRIRKRMPEVRLRSAFIVGFPGETAEEFDRLLAFVKDVRFDKMGAFMYSREEGTPAYDLPDQVSEGVKRQRFDRLMNEQQQISKELLESFVGEKIRVMIESIQPGEESIYLARSEYDAPDVDGSVFVHSSLELSPGDFVEVEVRDALEYDLIARVP